MKTLLIPLMLCSIFLTSCVSSMKITEKEASEIRTVDSKNYVIGVPLTAYVGEQLIQRKSYQTLVRTDLLTVKNDFTLSGGIGTTSISLKGYAGDSFKIAGTNNNGNYVVKIPGSHLMFGVSQNGVWDNTVMSASFWTSPIGSGGQYSMSPTNTRFELVESQTPLSREGYINHELIFTGIGTNGISLLYREYTFENMARSAFSQELVYPKESNFIRFRKYNIKIISVNPSELKFVVEEE